MLKVLLAVDGSPWSEHAVDMLVRQFPADRIEVRIFHASEWAKGLPASLSFGEGATAVDDLLAFRESRRAEGHALATRALEKVRAAGFRATAVVQESDPRHAILEIGQEWPADLIVLGSHGRTGLTRLLLGSVSDSVSRQARCSVQIVRGPMASEDDTAGSRAPLAPAIVPLIPAGRLRVLLAFDGSDGSAAASDAIVQQFVCDRLDVRVLHVDEWLENPPAPSLRILYQERRRQMHDVVAGETRRLTNVGVTATGIVRHGDAREAILDAAREWPADLIVLGSHGRTGLKRALLGSVSEAVSRHARTSVLIVRPSPGSVK